METCKPVVSCVCPPSTAGGGGGGGYYALCSVPKSLTTMYHVGEGGGGGVGVHMHCAGMLGAEKPYHHVPLLLRVTECGVVGYQLTQLFM